MFGERRFQISLIISVLIHSLVLFHLPFSESLILPKVITPIEVTYHHKLEREEAEDKVISKSFLKFPLSLIDTLIDKSIFDIKRHQIQKEPFSPEKIAFEKKIILPEIPSPNINSPVYLNYYQKIREKIRMCAYQNFIKPEQGEIYLSFTITSNGELKKLSLIEEKSSQSVYLRDIALKSIQDASPFPSFPKDLEFSELSFNVIISFEVE
jgi:TonB family protein